MKIKLDLYAEEVQMILDALAQLPLKVSVGLWLKIQQQVKEQPKEE